VPSLPPRTRRAALWREGLTRASGYWRGNASRDTVFCTAIASLSMIGEDHLVHELLERAFFAGGILSADRKGFIDRHRSRVPAITFPPILARW
jgi:hypothetical protein